jgi:hypothetical protein
VATAVARGRQASAATTVTRGVCGSSGRARRGNLRWQWPREAQLSPVAATVVRGVTVSGGGGHVRRGWLQQQWRPHEARVARVGGLHGGEDWLGRR